MGRACTVCSHPARDAIDAALAESSSKRRIAAHHAISEQAVRRHADRHLPRTLRRAVEASEDARADDLLGLARRTQQEALEVLEQAKADGNLGGVLQAIDRIHKGTALLATLLDRHPPKAPRTFADLMRRAEERTLTVRWAGTEAADE